MKHLLKKLLSLFVKRNVEEIPIAEVELDFIPPQEIKQKKKNPKQFDFVDDGKPFVKTRKKNKK